jgi:hypothetical protein
MQQPVQGLIFTPVRTPYASQGSIKLFQWNVVNSCSFKIQIIWDKERKAHYQLLIADQKTHKYFDDFSPEMELLREWKSSPPDGKIIDCIFDKEWETVLWENGYAGTVRKGGWKFVKFRNDKTMADDERKVKLHWKGFIDPVPLEIVFKINKLESNIEEMRTRWKMRERRVSSDSYYLLM